MGNVKKLDLKSAQKISRDLLICFSTIRDWQAERPDFPVVVDKGSGFVFYDDTRKCSTTKIQEAVSAFYET